MKKLLYPLLILIICLFLIVSCVPAQPELMDSVPTAEPSSEKWSLFTGIMNNMGFQRTPAFVKRR